MKKFIVLTGIVAFILFLSLQGIIPAQSSASEAGKIPAALVSHENNPLKLTDAQKEQIKAIRDEEKARIRPLISDLKMEEQKLKELRKSNAKLEDINAQKEKIRFLRDTIRVLRQNYETRIKNILTADQRARYEAKKKEMKEKRKEKKEERKERKKERKKEKEDKEDNEQK